MTERYNSALGKSNVAMLEVNEDFLGRENFDVIPRKNNMTPLWGVSRTA
jgi:hypothetical protein